MTVFIAELRKLSEHCAFDAVLNDTIRDRLVCGLQSEAIQKRLLTESNLTLQKAIEISVSMEMAAKEAQGLSSSNRLHKVSVEKQTERQTGESGGTCFRCGKGGHQPSDCWCKDLECHSCGKRGHIERACRGKKKSKGLSKEVAGQRKYTDKKKGKVHAVEQESKESSDSSDEVQCHVLSVTGASHGYWTSPLLDGKSVQMEIDTGVAVSLISEAV